jgi:hypothetical protein
VGTGHLVAGRSLAARDLGVRRAVANPLTKPLAEPPGHALARRQLRMGLGERAPASLALIAPLASAGRCVSRRSASPAASPAGGPDVERGAAATWARAGARDQLDIEVELVALLPDASHLEAVKADETVNVLMHPLFLLAP